MVAVAAARQGDGGGGSGGSLVAARRRSIGGRREILYFICASCIYVNTLLQQGYFTVGLLDAQCSGADLLCSLSGISIIYNPSRIMYKTLFLLYLMGLEKCKIFPLFLVPPLFLDNLTQITYNQNRIIYDTKKISIIRNLIFVPHFQ